VSAPTIAAAVDLPRRLRSRALADWHHKTSASLAKTGVGTYPGADVIRGYIQAELDATNARYAQVEQIKRFVIIDRDFTIESGELTPSLKLKRNVVYQNLADVFEAIYAG